MALFSVMGFSFSGAASNQGLMFVRLKQFEDRHRRRALGAGGARTHQRSAVRHSRRDRRRLHAAGDPGAEPLRRLRVPGPRSERRRHQTARGCDARRGRRGQPVADACGRASSARSRRTIRSCRSRSIASGRWRWACRSSRSRSALQIFLGSQYVNDFEFNNRAYRVYVQADQEFRSNPQAPAASSTPGRARARWCRSSRSWTMKETTAPQVINHFNLFRSASINGAAAPGVSSGEALRGDGTHRREDAARRDGVRVVGHLARGNESRPARPT